MAAQAGVVVQVLMRGRGGTTRARARSQGHWGEEDRRGSTMVGAGVQVVSVGNADGRGGGGGDDGGGEDGVQVSRCRGGC